MSGVEATHAPTHADIREGMYLKIHRDPGRFKRDAVRHLGRYGGRLSPDFSSFHHFIKGEHVFSAWRILRVPGGCVLGPFFSLNHPGPGPGPAWAWASVSLNCAIVPILEPESK